MTAAPWWRDPAPTRSAIPPALPTLVYDDDCAFCTKCARWMSRHSRSELALLGFSHVTPESGLLGSLDPATFHASAHFIGTGGREYHGGESITRAMRLLPWGWLIRPLDLPGVCVLRAVGYRLIANNRGLVSRLFRVG